MKNTMYINHSYVYILFFIEIINIIKNYYLPFLLMLRTTLTKRVNSNFDVLVINYVVLYIYIIISNINYTISLLLNYNKPCL